MAIELTIPATKTVAVKYLKVEAGVRYWEDAEVNGVEDEGGTKIPCRVGDLWAPVIDMDTGSIMDWPIGTTADIHYKVCDAGKYTLLDADRNEIKSIAGYVPSIMEPGGPGYGDYIVMEISESGSIAKWRVDLDAFESEEAA